MLAKHRAGQQWYFVDEQKVKEVWMIKICDSSEDPNIAKFCPHTSFTTDWQDSENIALRESIEVRAYVFYD
ncbi:hypothetical protein N0V90_005305 [Kalmusia sp. IMI 367209]|nr:hypothetical protein N0V90_005305 [Kalmusia sp. IMI 367209]